MTLHQFPLCFWASAARIRHHKRYEITRGTALAWQQFWAQSALKWTGMRSSYSSRNPAMKITRQILWHYGIGPVMSIFKAWYSPYRICVVVNWPISIDNSTTCIWFVWNLMAFKIHWNCFWAVTYMYITYWNESSTDCTVLNMHVLQSPYPTELVNFNFHPQPLVVVSRYRDPQLQVGDNYSYLFNLRPNIARRICKSWFFNPYFRSQYLWFNLVNQVIKHIKNDQTWLAGYYVKWPFSPKSDGKPHFYYYCHVTLIISSLYKVLGAIIKKTNVDMLR